MRVGPNVLVDKTATLNQSVDLSGCCCILQEAYLGPMALIKENARIFGNAVVRHAIVAGMAQVYEKAVVEGDALVMDNAQVFGTSYVTGGIDADLWAFRYLRYS